MNMESRAQWEFDFMNMGNRAQWEFYSMNMESRAQWEFCFMMMKNRINCSGKTAWLVSGMQETISIMCTAINLIEVVSTLGVQTRTICGYHVLDQQMFTLSQSL